MPTNSNDSTPHHMPGPWEASEQDVICLGGFFHCPVVSGNAVVAHGRGPTMQIAIENARLIAAAPETAAERDRLKEINAELLAELRASAELLEEAKTFAGNILGGLGLAAFLASQAEIARAAIAKAEGNS